MRVLVVEDESRMAEVIRRSLTKEGLATDVARDGEEALAMSVGVDYDAIVLDVMLPRRSGFEVCAVLRERGVWSPVLMLTACDGIEDRVAGLDCGADDYLVKPFALAELHARLRSLVRRGRPERPVVLRVGSLRLDPARREVHRGEVRIDLSAKEFGVLEALMRRPGEVLTIGAGRAGARDAPRLCARGGRLARRRCDATPRGEDLRRAGTREAAGPPNGR